MCPETLCAGTVILLLIRLGALFGAKACCYEVFQVSCWAL
jgi:hypothetical protein